jgi:hypothetical protein
MWVKSISNAIDSIIEVQHGGKRDIKCKTIDTPHRQRQHLSKQFFLISLQIHRILDFWCFNATFSNISATSWRPALVVEEAGVPGENHRL